MITTNNINQMHVVKQILAHLMHALAILLYHQLWFIWP